MTLTSQDLSAIGQLFNESFDRKFEPAFNKAFDPSFNKKFAPIKKKINKMARDLDTVIRSTDRRITAHTTRLRLIENHLNLPTPADSY